MTGAQRSRVGEASGYVGGLAARRPCAVIWGMVFWSLLMTMGLATMKVQTDGLYLWIPTQSSPYKNMLDMIDRFGPFRRNQILILYPKSGDNILTEENLKGVLDVHEDIAFNIVSDDATQACQIGISKIGQSKKPPNRMNTLTGQNLHPYSARCAFPVIRNS